MRAHAPRAGRNRASAVLHGARATLRLAILGYEFPELREELDADWLLVQIEWTGESGRMTYEGSFLLADELARLATRLAAPPIADALFFTEPNFALAWSPRDALEDRVVRLRLLHESSAGNTRVETALRVSDEAMSKFGTGLRTLALRFPARSTLTRGEEGAA